MSYIHHHLADLNQMLDISSKDKPDLYFLQIK